MTHEASKNWARPPVERFAPGIRRAEGLQEFANSIGVSYDTLFRKAQSGQLRTIRVGRRWLIPADEVERILREGL